MVVIKDIEIEAIRGIPKLHLDFEEKNILIKGDNGTGKSSIINSIEFFFTGKLSDFEGSGTGGLSTKQNLAHKNFDISDSTVKVTFNPNTLQLKRKYGEKILIPVELKDYLSGASNGKFILHRAEMLRYIITTPRDRFKAISSILGIEGLDEFELKFIQVKNEIQGIYENLKRDKAQMFEDISNILNTPINNLNEIIPIINEKRKNFDLEPLKSLYDFNNSLEILIPILKEEKLIDIIQNMVVFREKINSSKLQLDERDFSAIKNNFLKIDQMKYSEKDYQKSNFFRQGLKVIKYAEKDICPFCGLKIDTNLLISQIEKRINLLNELSSNASIIREKSSIIRSNAVGSIYRIKYNIRMLSQSCIIEFNFELINKLLIKFQQFINKISDVLKFQDISFLNEINNISKSINHELDNIINSLNEKIQKYVSPEKSSGLIHLIDITSSLKNKIIDIENLEKKINLYEQKAKISGKLAIKFTENKSNIIKKIYNEIILDINKFYSILHQDDPHESIDLSLSRDRSTQLKMTFSNEEEIDPRAFVSEGHLDSLGLCIFLAFVKKFNERCTLLILDDVVTTIDAGHREFIGKLLEQEFSHFQIVIATHDNIWFTQLQQYGTWKCYTLNKWSEEMGPEIIEQKPTWKRIQVKIELGDKKGVGSDSRTYLEWILKSMVNNTKTKVVLKETGSYTVGDLYYDLKKRLEKLISNQSDRKVILSAFEDLEKRKFMANLLAHDSPQSELLSMKEIRRFAQSVNNIKNGLSCDECGSFLIYPSEVKRLVCSNNKCKKPRNIICK